MKKTVWTVIKHTDCPITRGYKPGLIVDDGCEFCEQVVEQVPVSKVLRHIGEITGMRQENIERMVRSANADNN
jgi:hypothetical protein